MNSGDPVSVLLLLGALSLLPFALVATTSFVKFAVVLSILRSAIGTPQVPPTIVVTSLAMILTAYVMAPTGIEIYRVMRAGQHSGALARGDGLLSSGSAKELYAAAMRAKEPLRAFLVRHTSMKDRTLFRDLAKRLWPKSQAGSVQDSDLMIVIPAFVIGQLAAAFKIGFLLFVPFLVIDMVVANVLLALGMHMLSPTTISLPFKLLLFVLIDGWHLLSKGLIMSYA